MAQAIARRRRRLLILIVAGIIVVLVALSVLSSFYIDLLWFREVRLASVFWSIFWSKVVLGVVFGSFFFAVLYANLLIVRRLAPRYRAYSPEPEIIERYRLAFEPYAKWVLPAFAGFIALFVGIGATGQWEKFLLWRNAAGIEFGTPDPQFMRDPAFYAFILPFQEFVQGWLFSALVGITVVVAIAHYLWGGIRLQAVGERVTPQVKAHLSVLLGLIFLVKAWGYRLGQFDLTVSERGVVTGASFTDINAHLPALRLLVFIAIACAILFMVNIRFRGWALPVLGLGLLMLTSIVAGAIFPAAVQRFRVDPQEFQQERPFIERNIEATREAFQLEGIESRPHGVVPRLTPDDVEQNPMTIENIRLWDPGILMQNLASLQRIRRFYEFEDVDVDRYPIDGDMRVVMIAAREISQDGIPGGGGTWQNRHLVFTHGFGAVANPVNTSTPEGAPAFVLEDIPPEGQIEIEQPRIYYGEREDVPFIVVNTGAEELDFQGTEQDEQELVTFRYDGAGGIEVGGFFRRVLFAWRFRDFNLLISDLIEGDSRIMIFRDIAQRVPKAAPFLQYDGDPYSAIVDGRVVWIWDAYTTTDRYPYSDRLDVAQPTGGDLAGQVNYIRNSVKVVVDAFDGTMTFYAVDPTDAIIRVWQKAFPDLFTPVEEAPPELVAHFRYPENLFQVQAAQFANYHVVDAPLFYGKQDFWAVPEDPATAANIEALQGATVTAVLRPYYVLMRLPGEDDEEFVLIQPFTPEGRPNMVAWMAAKSDPDEYGELVTFEFPPGENVDGPVQVFARINQDRRFSAERTLLSQGGSRVLFGNLLVIPIEQSLLYVQPIFVQSAQANAIPELKRVVVVQGGVVGIGTTLEEAIADSLRGAPAPPPGEEPEVPPPTGSADERVVALLAQALEHFERAEAALRAGDLGTYQREVEIAQGLIAEAAALAGPVPSPSPSP